MSSDLLQIPSHHLDCLMETLPSSGRRKRAPISYNFRKFFISVWLRWCLSVQRKLPLWCLNKRRSDTVRVNCSLKRKRIATNLEFFIWNESTQAATKGFWKCGLQVAVHTASDPWALAQSGLSPKRPSNSWFCQPSVIGVIYLRGPTFLYL